MRAAGGEPAARQMSAGGVKEAVEADLGWLGLGEAEMAALVKAWPGCGPSLASSAAAHLAPRLDEVRD